MRSYIDLGYTVVKKKIGGASLDVELQATLRNYYRNPMAMGENVFSMQDARYLIRYGGMRPDRSVMASPDQWPP